MRCHVRGVTITCCECGIVLGGADGGFRYFRCFSRKFTAAGQWIAAEILGCRRSGSRNNSEIPGCSFAVFR